MTLLSSASVLVSKIYSLVVIDLDYDRTSTLTTTSFFAVPIDNG